MATIGINLGHDAGIALYGAGGARLVELERITRQRHVCGGNPEVDALCAQILARWLEEHTIEAVAISDYFAADSKTPVLAEIARLLEAPGWECKGIPSPAQLVQRLSVDSVLGARLPPGTACHVVRHHWAHASLAYHASGHDEAAVVALDGTGAFADSGIVAVGRGGELGPVMLLSNCFAPRFGLVYEALSKRVFGSQFDTGKTLGLAAHGEVIAPLVPLIRILFAGNRSRRAYRPFFELVAEDALAGAAVRYGAEWYPYESGPGCFRADRLATYGGVLQLYGKEFPDALQVNGEIFDFDFDAGTQRTRDLVATVQRTIERELVIFFRGLKALNPRIDTVCYAGGCALNINANSAILEESGFKELFIPSCCDDSGIALGAAMAVHPEASKVSPFRGRAMALAFSGLPFEEGAAGPEVLASAAAALAGEATGAGAGAGEPSIAVQQGLALPELIELAVELLLAGTPVGWIEGACETGPRALGHRTILAHPGLPGSRRLVSEVIKGREAFRPIAPICCAESALDHFDGPGPLSPTMLFNYRVREPHRRALSEVTHADGTARLQTIDQAELPNLHRLLRRFGDRYGIPVLINTSLNIKGKPIVNRLRDALEVIETTPLGALFLPEWGAVIARRAVIPG